MLSRLRHSDSGRSSPNDDDLALNLSFVLHERSDSRAVTSAVRASRSHAGRYATCGSEFAAPITRDTIVDEDIALWLTATIGLPHLLAEALSASPQQVVAVDGPATAYQLQEFFRAPAQLVIPETTNGLVGVAALLLRPGQRSSHLYLAGPYDIQTHHSDALRAIERLIQAHTGQWMPPRPLWPAAAESLLADEVY